MRCVQIYIHIFKNVYPRFVLVHFWICTSDDDLQQFFTYPIFQTYSRLVISTVKGHYGPELCPKTWELRHTHTSIYSLSRVMPSWMDIQSYPGSYAMQFGKDPFAFCSREWTLGGGSSKISTQGTQGSSISKPSACLRVCNVWWGIFWGNQLAKQIDMTWIGYHNSEFSATLPAMALLMMIECL